MSATRGVRLVTIVALHITLQAFTDVPRRPIHLFLSTIHLCLRFRIPVPSACLDIFPILCFIIVSRQQLHTAVPLVQMSTIPAISNISRLYLGFYND